MDTMQRTLAKKHQFFLTLEIGTVIADESLHKDLKEKPRLFKFGL
jgi:hypothetical protein